MPRGQITKRGKTSFLVRIFLGRDENGKQTFHTNTVRGKRDDAESYLTEKLRELDLGTFVQPVKYTLDEYLKKWLSTAARPRLRQRTFEDYEQYIKRYISPKLGKRKLTEIKPLDIQHLYSDMLERGLSARTVCYLNAILSSALKQAVKWQMLSRNPCDSVDKPRQQRKEMNAMTQEQSKKFLKLAKADKWSIIFELALASAMRPEEYFGLQWKDLDFEAGTLMVRRALVWKRKGGGWTLQEPKTPQSRRTIPLPASLLKSLREHKRKQAEARLKLGSAYQNNDFVFAGEFGNPILLSNLYRRHFQPIVEKLVEQGILAKKIRLYDLRHTCATLLLLAGVNAKVVSERLGHASITLTLDVYSHVLPNMQQNATEHLEKMLFGK